jgi:hypothetical protein
MVGIFVLASTGLVGARAAHDEAPACLGSGTDGTIQQALKGPGSQAVLCPNAVFQLSQKVTFTAPRQRIYTKSEPRGAARATLMLTDPTGTTAVDAIDQPGARLDHVVVDGGGAADPSVPPMQGGPLARCTPSNSDLCLGLLEFGSNATNQRVEWVQARNTRGFSTLLCRQGAKGVTVSHNEFLPNSAIGDYWPFEQTTQVADGISVECGNATVVDNKVVDATDAGIALYSPIGSVIARNTVTARSREVIFGIALIDTQPRQGDYRGVVVRDNIVDASGVLVANGIAIGPRVGCYVAPGAQSFDFGKGPQPDVITGATVSGNVLRGAHMGYGFVISGARRVTVTGNRDQSKHTGTPWPQTLPALPNQTAFTCPPPAAPAGFQYDAAHVSDSKLQAQFRPAQVEGAGNLCNPGDINGDGRIDAADVQLLQDMLQGGPQEPCRADLDRDGKIDSNDLAILRRLAGQG